MHAIVLAVCLWSVYSFNVATPGLVDRTGQLKGADFAVFYVAGWMSGHGQEHALNNPPTFVDVSRSLLPDLNGVYYLPVYGPQVALFFSPFATLPYGWALALWVSVIGLFYGASCWAVWRTCPQLRRAPLLVALVAIASPAFVNLVAHGQNSAVSLALFTAAYFALRGNRPFLAGLAIGSLVFKPQLGLVAACVFVLGREWRVVAGALAAAGLQFGVAWAVYGTAVMQSYWGWLRGLGELTDLLWVKPYQMHSLAAFWNLLAPWAAIATGLYILSAAAVTLAACWVWQSRAPLSLRYSVLLLATVLASPHVYVYDLVILVPAFLLCADWTLQAPREHLSRPVQRALYFSYVLPLVAIASQVTRVQASVIAMSAAMVLAVAVVRRQHSRLGS